MSRFRPIRRPGGLLIGAIALIGSISIAVAETISGLSGFVDLGDHFVSIQSSTDAVGSCSVEYAGDLTRFAVQWNITDGSVWPRCGKGRSAASTGYPKLVDSLSGRKVLSYNSQWIQGNGGRQVGAYIWLGRKSQAVWAQGDWTHEINIWNWATNNNQANGEFIGTYFADGGEYRVHRHTQTSAGQTFTAWTVIRTQDSESMNLNVRTLLNWLRARGLPNHYVLEITPAVEGLTASGPSSGHVVLTKIQVPDL
jgi:hypothetical protein